MKEFCFGYVLFCFVIIEKVSIGIFIVSIRTIFTAFQFIFVKRSCSRLERQAYPISFLFFRKALRFLDIVSAHK